MRGLLGRFVAVCNAVAYAHSRGVLHRDLKPGNVMLGPYGETLVVDWGLAKVVGRPAGGDGASEGTLRPPSAEGSAPTQVGAAVGTPAYMSPEQAAGKVEELGPASDIYSLGATLYCLLTGKAPVEGQDAGEILRRVQRGDFAPPRAVKPGVPRALEAVCIKAMPPEALACEGEGEHVQKQTQGSHLPTLTGTCTTGEGKGSPGRPSASVSVPGMSSRLRSAQ
jgi:serine/threonine protein kinase